MEKCGSWTCILHFKAESACGGIAEFHVGSAEWLPQGRHTSARVGPRAGTPHSLAQLLIQLPR